MKDIIEPEPRPGPIAEHDKDGEAPPKTPVRQEEPDTSRPGPVTEDPGEGPHAPDEERKRQP